MDTFSSKANKDANRLGAGRCSGLSFVDKEHNPMSKTPHPYRIHEPRTSFLKQTMARAVTPRAKARAEALRELERLIAIKADGGSLGVRGHLLASIARDYPVSNRALALELFGHGPQGLVEVAEQIELRLWLPFKSTIPTASIDSSSKQVISKGKSND
jgi:hypothetical protein